MVEVFKTNVKDCDHATMLLEQIKKNLAGYNANFDLDDCDKILRVQSETVFIQSSSLINLLKEFGFDAEVLPDDAESVRWMMSTNALSAK